MILKTAVAPGAGHEKRDAAAAAADEEDDSVAVSTATATVETEAECETAAGAGNVAAKEILNRVPRRVPVVELNEHLTCYLCKGYFIEATTIIECLHSFCRSCIVTYLESNKYCPVCEVQVHKTKPLLNIRPDKILQDITYKLVPKLFQNELQKRREFYAHHPDAKPSQLETRADACYQHLLTPDEMLCISLLYDGASEKCTPRYLRCSASVSMAHLQKLIRNKYDLSPLHRVEILHQGDALASYLTLMDVAYIYLWRRKVPLALTYRIFENIKTSLVDAAENNNNRPDGDSDGVGEDGWKEVQLRISENGEMSVTGIQDCLSLLDANILQDDHDQQKDAEKNAAASEGAAVVLAHPKKIKLDKKGDRLREAKEKLDRGKKVDKRETRSALQVKTSNTNTVLPEKEKEKSKEKEKDKDKEREKIKSSKIPKDRKRKSMELSEGKDDRNSDEVESKKSKLSELQSTLPPGISITTKSSTTAHPHSLQNLSKNHPLKKHSLANNAKSVTATVTTAPSVVAAAPLAHAQTSAHAPASIQTTAHAPASIQTSAHAPPASAHASTTSTDDTDRKLQSAKQAPAHAHQHYGGGGYTPPRRVYTPPGSNYTPLAVPNVAASMRLPTPPMRPYAHAQQAVRFRQESTATRPAWGTHRQPTPTPASQATPPPPPLGGGTGTPTTPGAPSDLRNVRPAKFFKMRNNMPRYLGCPASGVKPMYMQEHPAAADKDKDDRKDEKKEKQKAKEAEKVKDVKEKVAKKADEKKPSSTEIKRHSIVKIDPKTLKPITEKAPDMTSLISATTIKSVHTSTVATSTYAHSNATSTITTAPSTTLPPAVQQDLKINTSSVSIFNPIKLQSERKSPHSPSGSKRPVSSPTMNSPNAAASSTTATASASASSSSTLSSAANGGSPLGMAHAHSPGGIMPMSPTTMSMLHHHQHHHKNHKAAAAASLNYTPPNPFVPNLAAAGMSPGGFMYPSPTGFPYDPMMAAFLAYSRPPFNYDFRQMAQMNQLGFGPPPLPPPTPREPSPNTKKLKLDGVEKLEKAELKSRRVDKERPAASNNLRETNEPAKEKDAIKERKESPTHGKTSNKAGKGEKSLQNALDKLTKAKMADSNDATTLSVFPIAGDKSAAEPDASHTTEQNHRPTKTKNKVEIKSDITITPAAPKSDPKITRPISEQRSADQSPGNKQTKITETVKDVKQGIADVKRDKQVLKDVKQEKQIFEGVKREKHIFEDVQREKHVESKTSAPLSIQTSKEESTQVVKTEEMTGVSKTSESKTIQTELKTNTDNTQSHTTPETTDKSKVEARPTDGSTAACSTTTTKEDEQKNEVRSEPNLKSTPQRQEASSTTTTSSTSTTTCTTSVENEKNDEKNTETQPEQS